MSARTRGASAAAGAVTARCASARPRSQTRLATRVAEPPRPPLGSHDHVHRLASRRASPSLRGRRSARTTTFTDSPRDARRRASAAAARLARPRSWARLGRRGPSPATPCGSRDLGDQADVLGVGAAAGADDVAPRVEQRGVVARQRPGPELVGDRVALRDREPRVRVRDERRVRDLAPLAADEHRPVGLAPAVHPDDVGAGGEEARGHVRRALAPHRPVAVVQLLVLEEHRRHYGDVRDLLARAHRCGRVLREHHGLDREEVHAALGERLRLLAERRDVLLVGHPRVERVVAGQPARGADRARDVCVARGDRPGQPRTLRVQLARPLTELVLVELEAAAAEGVGLDDLAAGVEVAFVDPLHDLGVGVVPQLGAPTVGEARGEEHGAVPAVEDEDLARADAFEDFPAARRHGATSASTPRSVLALTTARVESFAYPSAPISLANAWLTGAPPTLTFTRARRPARTSASIVRFIAGMVVVMSAEMPTMFALCSSTARTKASGATSRPRLTTLNPAPSSIMATRFLPMSWRSPWAVPMTTTP